MFVVENLDTRRLAADGVREFALILTHPKLRGASGAWTSPIALVYGLLWWLRGPLTLLPILLGAPPQWTLAAASATFPSLVGHLAYGAALGVAFYRLEARYSPWWLTRNEIEAERAERRREQVFGSAPALWAVIAMFAVTVPLLLGQ